MYYWAFLPIGYVLTILIETPILVVAGWWLTACTYPIVVVVLPQFFDMADERQYRLYLAVAETFAPFAECALFYALFIQPEVNRGTNKVGATIVDLGVVTLANLASFGFGVMALPGIMGSDNPLWRAIYEP